jgi:TPP-dependent 2-oxoacid decarboxylase
VTAGAGRRTRISRTHLRPDTAPAEIDRVLSTELRTSRPVFLAIPADVAGMATSTPVMPG